MTAPKDRLSQRHNSKVKTGCRTCKLRKVKCDEGRPACSRCVSNGRYCPGYGVWDKPIETGHFRQARLQQEKHQDLTIRRVLPEIRFQNANERNSFNYYRTRLTIKLPGAGSSDFWETLVLQACGSEPAVFHSLVALSAAHDSVAAGRRNRRNRLGDQELFVLGHYDKAIRDVQPKCSRRDRESLRIVLISCVIFVSIEFLQGHYRTAVVHLQNGLRLFRRLLAYNASGARPSDSWIDDWVEDVLTSMAARTAVFSPGFHELECSISTLHIPPASRFDSMAQARACLDKISERICYIKATAAKECFKAIPKQLRQLQIDVLQALDDWNHRYQSSKTHLLPPSRTKVHIAWTVLLNLYSMAQIRASTALVPDSSPELDAQLPLFHAILTRSIEQFKMPRLPSIQTPASEVDTSYISDMGWVPQLYFMAVKCRFTRIREHAIRLLGTTQHQEGIWSSQIVRPVARRVTKLEHHAANTDQDAIDSEKSMDFDIGDVPGLQEIQAQGCAPLGKRLDEVDIKLPDEPDGLVVVKFSRSGVVHQEIFNVITGLWERPISPMSPMGWLS